MRAHRDLVRELEAQGCDITHSKAGHIKVRRPNGSYAMTMSISPSDINAAKKARQLAVRLGLLEKTC